VLGLPRNHRQKQLEQLELPLQRGLFLSVPGHQSPLGQELQILMEPELQILHIPAVLAPEPRIHHQTHQVLAQEPRLQTVNSRERLQRDPPLRARAPQRRLVPELQNLLAVLVLAPRTSLRLLAPELQSLHQNLLARVVLELQTSHRMVPERALQSLPGHQSHRKALHQTLLVRVRVIQTSPRRLVLDYRRFLEPCFAVDQNHLRKTQMVYWIDQTWVTLKGKEQRGISQM
jgi:hypothetical protein